MLNKKLIKMKIIINRAILAITITLISFFSRSQNEKYISYFDEVQIAIKDTNNCTRISCDFQSDYDIYLRQFECKNYSMFILNMSEESGATNSKRFVYVSHQKDLVVERRLYEDYCSSSSNFYEMFFILDGRKFYRVMVDCDYNINEINQSKRLIRKDKKYMRKSIKSFKKSCGR